MKGSRSAELLFEAGLLLSFEILFEEAPVLDSVPMTSASAWLPGWTMMGLVVVVDGEISSKMSHAERRRAAAVPMPELKSLILRARGMGASRAAGGVPSPAAILSSRVSMKSGETRSLGCSWINALRARVS